MNYEFTQKVSKEDYIAFVTNHIKISFFKLSNILLFTISIGYLMISPFVLGTDDFTFLFIGLGIILLLGMMMFYVRKNAGKTYDKNPNAFDMTYKITEENLVYIVPEGDITRKWDEFYSINETEGYLYLYVNKNSGLVFVKSQVNREIIDFIIRNASKTMKPKRVKLLKK
jgi:hypothetical protein